MRRIPAIALHSSFNRWGVYVLVKVTKPGKASARTARHSFCKHVATWPYEGCRNTLWRTIGPVIGSVVYYFEAVDVQASFAVR